MAFRCSGGTSRPIGDWLWRRVAACLVFLNLELDTHLVHGVKNQPERLHYVAKDDRLPLQLLILAEPLSVDQLHLLQHC